MRHRHLIDDQFTAPAVDDLIARGRWDDWVELREAVLHRPDVRATVARLCVARSIDAAAQRYWFWRRYVERLA
jgi:hypothetical protein